MQYPAEIKVSERLYPIHYEKVSALTSSVRIKNGAVMLKLSRFAYGQKRDEIISKFLKWAEKRLSRISYADFILPDYKDGGRIVTHNKIYELQIQFEDRKTALAKLNGSVIQVFLPSGKLNMLKQVVEKLIIRDQKNYLAHVIDELNQLYFREKYNFCRFKRMNHRFGSLSSKRNINIAFRLLFAPREVFKYVCLHELAHLKEFNHSKRFWNLVADAMPEYKDHEKWLRHNGFMLG